MSIGAAVQADHRKIEAIIGSHDLGVALGGRSNRETRRSYGHSVEKLASSYHFYSCVVGRCRSIVMR